MPRTTTKSAKKTKAPAKRPAQEPAAPTPAGEVLTLAEAAAYLRLPEEEVKRLARTDGLPGRAVGEDWRFLKSAVQEWLRTPPPAGPSKDGLLSLIGTWKDDPFFDDIKEAFEKNRGRPMFEDG